MLATRLVALKVAKVDEFAAALRHAPLPIIGRITADQFFFDPRTVLPKQETHLMASLIEFLGNSEGVDVDVGTGLVPAPCGATTRVARTLRNPKEPFIALRNLSISV